MVIVMGQFSEKTPIAITIFFFFYYCKKLFCTFAPKIEDVHDLK
jgi:hypothetical protein